MKILHVGLALVSCSVLLVVGFGAATIAWSQTPAVDPQSLVGEWAGEWKMTVSRLLVGAYTLTVEKVEGDTVYGKVETRGASGGRGSMGQSFPFQGRLEGNRLKFGTTELTVSGSTMEGGWEREGRHGTVSLMKRK